MQFKAVYLCKGFRGRPCYVLLEQNRHFHAGVWFFSQWDKKMPKVKASLIFLSFWSSADLLYKSRLTFTEIKIFKSLFGTSISPINVFICIYISKNNAIAFCSPMWRVSETLGLSRNWCFSSLVERKVVAILIFPFYRYSLNAVCFWKVLENLDLFLLNYQVINDQLCLKVRSTNWATYLVGCSKRISTSPLGPKSQCK